MPLRRSLRALGSAVAGGAVAFAPASSARSRLTSAPACKRPAKPPRLPLAQGVSIRASPNPVSAGQRVTVFGALISVSRGVRRCGETIVLRRRFPDQRRFTPIARTVTTAGGRYSFVMPAGSIATNRDWLVSARGLRSRAIVELVQRCSRSRAATFAVAGDAETLSGQLRPGRGGQAVALERLVGKHWITVARPRLTRALTFSTARTFTTTRTEQWRATAPASIHNLAAQSAVVRIRDRAGDRDPRSATW